MIFVAVICPHCNSNIMGANEVAFGTKLFYTCPKCSKILSVERHEEIFE